MKRALGLLVFLGIALAWSAARADEGMWLFTQPPRKTLKEKYAFDLSEALLARLQKAAVLVGSGGSGAFVSADGLILTNQHVVTKHLDELSEGDRDVYVKGYVAAARDKEMCCPSLDVSVLSSMEDVTARVLAAIKPGMTMAEAAKARKAVLCAIQDESWRCTGLVSAVVSVYHGAGYHLYRYKRYTDVRLVFAPEKDVSKLFDVCLFRAYENGQPAKIAQPLRFSRAPATEGDLILIPGFPGATDRFRTAADLEYRHGPASFLHFKALSRLNYVLTDFAKAHPDLKRQLRHDLESLDYGTWAAADSLANQEEYLAPHREREEARLAEMARKDPLAAKQRRQALERIDACRKDNTEVAQSYFFLEASGAFETWLFSYARMLLRHADESAKPSAERLYGYQDADRDDFKRALLHPRKFVKELEILKLADCLDLFARYAGPDAELAAKILDGKAPKERARLLIEGSKLDQLEVRRALFEGRPKAVRESKDALLVFAQLIDPRSRSLRQAMAERIHEPCLQTYNFLGKDRMNGTEGECYPDANHTLRLSFGKVHSAAASKKLMGSRSHAFTFADFFRYVKKSGQEDRLSEIWQAAWNQLCDDKTPLIFASSADVSPGNSGSPLVDRQGRVVGVAAWGTNDHMNLAYLDADSGCGGVSASAILTVLEKVYHVPTLVKELGGEVSAIKLASALQKADGFPSAPPPPVLLKALLPSSVPPGLAGFAPSGSFVPPIPIPMPTLPGQGTTGVPSDPSAPSIKLPSLSYLPSLSVDAPPLREAGLAKRHKELVPALVKALKDDEEVVRAAAANALVNLGSDAVPALIEALTGKNLALRQETAAILGQMGSAGRDAVPALIAALQDEDARFRRAAANALREIVRECGKATAAPPPP